MATRKRRSLTSGRSSTITQVALEAEVSVATVSRALRMPEVVSEAARRRVQQAISRLGYTPNAQARSLRTAKTGLVLALVPDLGNPFYAEVIRGVEEVAHPAGYSVLLGDTRDAVTREQAYAEMIPAHQADGLITFFSRAPRLPEAWRAALVNVCEYVADTTVSSVYVDNVRAAMSAVDHLIALGHRDIAYISGPSDRPICEDRTRGYARALEGAGLTINPELCVVGDFTFEAGVRGIEALIARGRRFSALFCANDDMAIAAMSALKAQGRRVPEDVSVVGFDDVRFARYVDPPLTTIAQPKRGLGAAAMQLLIESLSGLDTTPRKRILPTELIVRGSTARRA